MYKNKVKHLENNDLGCWSIALLFWCTAFDWSLGVGTPSEAGFWAKDKEVRGVVERTGKKKKKEKDECVRKVWDCWKAKCSCKELFIYVCSILYLQFVQSLEKEPCLQLAGAKSFFFFFQQCKCRLYLPVSV